MDQLVFQEVYQGGRIEVRRGIAADLHHPYIYRPYLVPRDGQPIELKPQPFVINGAILVARSAAMDAKFGKVTRGW